MIEIRRLDAEILENKYETQNHGNHFAMVENFIDKYVPVLIQSQISETLQIALPYKEVTELVEYEKTITKKFHEAILNDDGMPDLVSKLNKIKANLAAIDFSNYQGIHVKRRQKAERIMNEQGLEKKADELARDTGLDSPDVPTPGSPVEDEKNRTGGKHKTRADLAREQSFIDKAQKVTKRERVEHGRRMERLSARGEVDVDSVDQADAKMAQEAVKPLMRKSKYNLDKGGQVIREVRQASDGDNESLRSMSSHFEPDAGGKSKAAHLQLEHDLQKLNKIVSYLDRKLQKTVAHIERIEQVEISKVRDLVHETKAGLQGSIDTSFTECQSKINEFNSYLEDLHKEMTRFMLKKKQEN